MVKSASYKVVWDVEALQHFKEVLTYLEKQSKQAPKILKQAIFDKLALIQTNPTLFEPDKLKDPSDREFRAFVVFSYRLSYQVKSEIKEIRILRIRHTSREPLGY